MIWFSRIASPVGGLLAVADATGALTGLYFADAEHAGGAVPADAREDRAPFAAIRAQLEEYFAGARRAFEVPLAPRGTPFQRAVWRGLSAIPYGETTTYAALARAVGRPSAARAVGAANGKNPLSIVVPCHRVIGAGGTLAGYAGGIANKRRLLDHEARSLRRPV